MNGYIVAIPYGRRENVFVRIVIKTIIRHAIIVVILYMLIMRVIVRQTEKRIAKVVMLMYLIEKRSMIIHIDRHHSFTRWAHVKEVMDGNWKREAKTEYRLI
jgi:hypothetical protein